MALASASTYQVFATIEHWSRQIWFGPAWASTPDPSAAKFASIVIVTAEVMSCSHWSTAYWNAVWAGAVKPV